MSTERDQGLEALQRGDATTAVTLLESACQQDPNDYQAHMYLGAAYGQADRHDDAIQTLTRAVQIDPANAQARFNLGIALERAGWPNEALTALQQAVTLQPDYANAQQAVQRVQQKIAATAQPTTAMPAAPTPTTAMPPQGGLASGGYAPPSAPYAAPVRPVTSATPITPYYEDRFDLKQGFADWWKVLTSPQAFFQNQAGREGVKAPLATFIAYWLMSSLFSVVMAIVKPTPSPLGSPIVSVIVTIPFILLFGLLFVYLFAATLHFVGKLFGNTANFAGSVRVYVYSSAPLQVMGLLVTILSPLFVSNSTASNMMDSRAPSASQERIILVQDRSGGGGGMTGSPGQPQTMPDFSSGQYGAPRSSAPNPLAAIMPNLVAGVFGLILMVVAFVWSLILAITGLSSVQGISSGAAFGTIIISFIAWCIVGFILFLGLLAVGVAVGAAAGGMK